MVLKRSKHDMNTGATFKFGKWLSFFSKEGSYVKKITDRARTKEQQEDLLEIAKEIDDGGLSIQKYHFYRWATEGCEYSLKKLNRWKIAQHLYNEIDEFDTLQEEPSSSYESHKQTSHAYKIVMVTKHYYAAGERHGSHTTSSYHDSSALVPHVYAKSKHSQKLKKLHNEIELRSNIPYPKRSKRSKPANYDSYFFGPILFTNLSREHHLELSSRSPSHVPNVRKLKRQHACGKQRSSRGIQRKQELTQRRTWTPTEPEDFHVLPEIRYEVCYPRQLNSHRKNCDYGHKLKYWWGDYHCKKLNKGLCKRKHYRVKNIDEHLGYTQKEFNELRYSWNKLSVSKGRAHDKFGLYGLSKWRKYATFKQESVTRLSKSAKRRRRKTENKRKVANKNKSKEETEYETLPSLPVFGDFVVNGVSLIRNQTNKKKKRIKKYTSGYYYEVPGKDAYTPQLLSVKEPEHDQDSVEQGQEGDTSQSVYYIVKSRHDEPIQCVVSSRDIQYKTLVAKYDDAFIEGHGIPRRFMINLTSVYHSKCAVDGDSHGKLTFAREVFLVCETVPRNNNNIVTDDLPQSSDEEKSSDNEWEFIETTSTLRIVLEGEGADDLSLVFNSYIHSLSQQSNVAHFETIVQTILTQPYFDNSYSSPTLVATPFDLSSDLGGYNIKVYPKRAVYDVLQHEPLQTSKKRIWKWCSNSIVSFDDVDHTIIHCDICFGSISGDSVQSVSALRGCHHWFCDVCWKRYLLQRIRVGDVTISCPGVNCNTLIDQVTLLWFLSYQRYKEHMNRVQEAKIERSYVWGWCPNERCDNVVNIQNFQTCYKETVPAATVRCVCKKSYCFLCHQRAHWPATCIQAEKFEKIAKQRGDFGKSKSAVYYAHVKKCPKCNYPMEKNGGCQHMNCRCGHSFCWSCLGSLDTHVWNISCGGGKGVTIVELDDTRVFVGRESMYALAVHHYKQLPRLRTVFTPTKMEHICRLTKVKKGYGSITSQVSKIVVNEADLETLTEAVHFIIEGHELLTNVCTMMYVCPRSHKNNRLRNYVQRLGFTLSVVEETMLNPAAPQMILTKLKHFKTLAMELFPYLIRDIQISRRKIHSADTEFLNSFAKEQ